MNSKKEIYFAGLSVFFGGVTIGTEYVIDDCDVGIRNVTRRDRAGGGTRIGVEKGDDAFDKDDDDDDGGVV